MVDGVGMQRVDNSEIVDHLSGVGSRSPPIDPIFLVGELPMRWSYRESSLAAVMPVSGWLPRIESGRSLS